MIGVRRLLDRAGFLGVTSGVLLSGFVHGFYALTLRVEVAFAVLVIVLLEAVVSSLLFSAFVLVSGGIFLAQLFLNSREAETVVDGNTVTAIVPVYRDGDVLPAGIDSLRASNYGNLSIVIVPEPDDEEGCRRAAELGGDDVSVLVNTRYPGSKAGAINYAVEETDSDYVAVFEADERVDPDFIPRAVALLRDYDVVQGRTVPQPEGFVEALAYYESVLLSYAARRLLYWVTGFRLATSRAVVMRRTAFEAAGGYDLEMLTEDFDFAYRCYEARLSVAEALSHPSRIEAAHSLTDWWGQRKRWMTGYAQVLHRLAWTIRPTDYRSVLSAVICASTVGGSVLMLSMFAKFAVLLVVGAESLFLPPLAAVAFVTLGVRLYDRRTGAVDGLDVYWLLVGVLLPLYSLAAIKAVFEYLLTWDGDWYAVEKTKG